MAEIADLLGLVKTDIEKIDLAIKTDLKMLAPQVDDLLLEILEYGLLGGGKRIRPLLAVVCARLCQKPGADVYQLAIAFEYLHLATLFHDDVIDQADTRRGKASVCHAYGLSAAILAGDFLHARSMEMVGRYGGTESLDVFCKATRGMVDGEFIQLRNAHNYSQSEKDYYAAIEGKTALLISSATEIGAITGGGTADERNALMEYGRNLGFGFQIADDLLDYLGDEQKTGKAVGNDLAEGKMTLPLIMTLEQSSAADRMRLIEILKDAGNRRACFEEVVDLINRYDGFALTRKRAEQCITRAKECLTVFSEEKRQDIEILAGLASYALLREK